MTWNPPYEGQAGNIGAFQIVKAKLKSAGEDDVKIMLSIGGSTKHCGFPGRFSECAVRDKRSKLITSMVKLVEEYKFDGIDLDWGCPRFNDILPTEAENYLKMLKEIRTALDVLASTNRLPHLQLSIAQGMHPKLLKKWKKNIKELCSVVDFMNLLSYDYLGTWAPYTEINAPLFPHPNAYSDKFNVQWGLKYLKKNHCPSSKMVLGIPLYGRCWTDVTPGQTRGLHQEAGPQCVGTWELGLISYHDMSETWSEGSGYTRYWDDITKTPYAFNDNTKEFISFENERSVAAKARYAAQQGLAGFMFWEASDDKFVNSGTIVELEIKHYELLGAAHKGWDSADETSEDSSSSYGGGQEEASAHDSEQDMSKGTIDDGTKKERSVTEAEAKEDLSSRKDSSTQDSSSDSREKDSSGAEPQDDATMEESFSPMLYVDCNLAKNLTGSLGTAPYCRNRCHWALSSWEVIVGGGICEGAAGLECVKKTFSNNKIFDCDLSEVLVYPSRRLLRQASV
eukprot:GHVQ01012940.1.p1 GENE.GHVQ01012940.1~~GHVQ01012940.1.p1  ORF type:complete len:510 (-),score=82.84 GHVQ01012940.1:353-1882(-)